MAGWKGAGASSLSQPADPEPFTLNRETGAKGEVSRNQGTEYGVQDTGCGVKGR